MKTILIAAASLLAAFTLPTAAASRKDTDTCWRAVADAQDFIAAAPGYYSVETDLDLERCIKKIGPETILGKRLRKLHDFLEAQPLGGE